MGEFTGCQSLSNDALANEQQLQSIAATPIPWVSVCGVHAKTSTSYPDQPGKKLIPCNVCIVTGKMADCMPTGAWICQ
jgi:hypothetical protein